LRNPWASSTLSVQVPSECVSLRRAGQVQCATLGTRSRVWAGRHGHFRRQAVFRCVRQLRQSVAARPSRDRGCPRGAYSSPGEQTSGRWPFRSGWP